MNRRNVLSAMIAAQLLFLPAFAQAPPRPGPPDEQRRIEEQRRAEEQLRIEERMRAEEQRRLEEEKPIDDQGQMKIYDIKWRDPEEISELLMPFASFPGHEFVGANPAFKTVTVRGTPEILAVIDGLIKKYDVPARELEFQFFLLRGRKTGTGVKDGVPEDIRKVLEDVSSLTAFKSFDLIDSPIVRATEGRPVSVDSKGDNISGRIDLSPPVLVTTDSGTLQIRIDRFQLRCEFPGYEVLAPPEPGQEPQRIGEGKYRTAGMETSFRIADGETIVVGSSGVRGVGSEPGDAVIAVVRAKVLK
jgi:hypothetical protein